MKKYLTIFLFLFLIIISSCSVSVEKGPNNDSSDTRPRTDGEIPSITPIEDEDIDDIYKVVPKSYRSSQSVIDDYMATSLGRSLYASPFGDGDGSIKKPYNLYDALDALRPGDTLYLMGGVYEAESNEGFYISNSGNKNNYITIKNYNTEKPIIKNPNNSNETAALTIDEGVSYVIIDGIEISDVYGNAAYGIVSWGNINHIILKNLDIHDIKTTNPNPNESEDAGANAILMMGETISPISDVLIYSSKCYNIKSGWSEAVSISANCEYCYIIGNSVYDTTNIGIDYYGNKEGYCPSSSLNQPRYGVCALNNLYNNISGYADCASIYIDGARDVLVTNNFVKDSAYGIEVGSEEKNEDYPVKNIMVRNNIISGCNLGIRIGGYQIDETGYVCDSKFINNTLLNNDIDFLISKVDGINIINNASVSKSTSPLFSLEFGFDYAKKINIKNNIFYNLDIKIEIGNSIINGKDNINNIFSSNIFESFTLDDEYKSDYLKEKGISSEYGDYDYYLNKRVNNIIDLGAVER